MITRPRRRSELALVVGVVGVLLLPSAAPARAADAEIVAWLNGEPITRDDVGPEVAFRVWRHEVDVHSILRDATERLVDERLLAAEAKRQGKTPDAVVAAAEAAAEGAPISEEEVDAYLAEHPRESEAAATAARPRIRHFLEERRRIEGRLALMKRLREAAGYRFVLAPPEQPRARIDTGDAPSRGPADAPVVLVHFASFSARDSARSAQRVARLRSELPGKLRQVHLSFLGERDEVGLLAAQLAHAARERGVFWEVHDALFARQGRLSPKDVRATMREAGLDEETIARAAGDPARLDAVRREIALGVTVGVPRAPALLVNGRYVSGLVPYDELLAIVREELDASRNGE